MRLWVDGPEADKGGKECGCNRRPEDDTVEEKAKEVNALREFWKDGGSRTQQQRGDTHFDHIKHVVQKNDLPVGGREENAQRERAESGGEVVFPIPARRKQQISQEQAVGHPEKIIHGPPTLHIGNHAGGHNQKQAASGQAQRQRNPASPTIVQAVLDLSRFAAHVSLPQVYRTKSETREAR